MTEVSDAHGGMTASNLRRSDTVNVRLAEADIQRLSQMIYGFMTMASPSASRTQLTEMYTKASDLSRGLYGLTGTPMGRTALDWVAGTMPDVGAAIGQIAPSDMLYRSAQRALLGQYPAAAGPQSVYSGVAQALGARATSAGFSSGLTVPEQGQLLSTAGMAGMMTPGGAVGAMKGLNAAVANMQQLLGSRDIGTAFEKLSEATGGSMFYLPASGLQDFTSKMQRTVVGVPGMSGSDVIATAAYGAQAAKSMGMAPILGAQQTLDAVQYAQSMIMARGDERYFGARDRADTSAMMEKRALAGMASPYATAAGGFMRGLRNIALGRGLGMEGRPIEDVAAAVGVGKEFITQMREDPAAAIRMDPTRLVDQLVTGGMSRTAAEAVVSTPSMGGQEELYRGGFSGAIRDAQSASVWERLSLDVAGTMFRRPTTRKIRELQDIMRSAAGGRTREERLDKLRAGLTEIGEGSKAMSIMTFMETALGTDEYGRIGLEGMSEIERARPIDDVTGRRTADLDRRWREYVGSGGTMTPVDKIVAAVAEALRAGLSGVVFRQEHTQSSSSDVNTGSGTGSSSSTSNVTQHNQ